jgi:hypothetical protein
MISLFFISILSILSLISINNIDYVYAQFNETQRTQLNVGTIEPQPLVNTETGQDIMFPGKLIGITDPQTGQIIAKEVQIIPPKVTGPSVTSSNADGLFSTSGLPDSGQGGVGVPITTEGRLTGNELSGSELLFSTSGATPTTLGNSAPPTFNPPLKKCDTVASEGGGFDIAKYAFTGNMDKDKLKGDDFAFQIFADLVDGDDYEIEGEDAPYKATMLTDNGDKKVNIHMKEIATLCIDTQHAINIEKITAVDLEKSDLFKSLEY